MQCSWCTLPHAVLLALCLLLLLQLQAAAAVSCTTAATFQAGTSGCPPAVDAVALLLGNNNQILSANAVFTGNCVTTSEGINQMGLITDFGACHYLSDSFTTGAVVLSTGKAVYGSYAYNSATASGGVSTTTVTDSDLQTAKSIIQPSESLYDAAILEFDVTPMLSGSLAWQFVFGSEEYRLLTSAPGIKYADIFVMTIKGPTDTSARNVALVPGSTTPISILSINGWTNSAYYLHNKINTSLAPVNGKYNMEFEGFTTLLTTELYSVTAGQTYHIKLAIADGDDRFYDSIVWVKAGSLNFYVDSTTPATTPTTNIACVGSWSSWSACNVTACDLTGQQSSTYTITTNASGTGAACEAANGELKFQPCFTAACPNVDCVGSWSQLSACNAVGCGTTGNQTATYTITTPASGNGKLCEAANGAQNRTTCSSNPCPVDCVGSWSSWTQCDAPCNGTGQVVQTYNITTPAAWGGQSCPQADGDNNTEPCISDPCPVLNIDCQGEWGSWSACNVTDCGLTGQKSKTYTITTNASGNGTACEAANGGVEFQPCFTAACPNVDCVGSWSQWSACNAVGCGTTGNQTATYTITTPASGNGKLCEAANGAQNRTTCSSNPCPVDCVGSWSDWTECDAPCNGTGEVHQTYNITTAASWGGQACATAHGAVQTRECHGDPCPPLPINCTGSFVYGECNATCGGGVQTGLFVVTTAAANGGTQCSYANQTTGSRACNIQRCVQSSRLATINIQVSTTKKVCEQTVKDFLLTYWLDRLSSNSLVEPDTVAVTVGCNDAQARRRALLTEQQALYSVKTTFQLRVSESAQGQQAATANSPATTKEAVSQVVAAVQDLIVNGDFGQQLSSNTNATLTKDTSVDVLALPQEPCATKTGYHAAWNSDHTALTCEPDSYNTPNWAMPVAIGVTVSGLMLVAAAALVARQRISDAHRGSQHRSQASTNPASLSLKPGADTAKQPLPTAEVANSTETPIAAADVHVVLEKLSMNSK